MAKQTLQKSRAAKNVPCLSVILLLCCSLPFITSITSAETPPANPTHTEHLTANDGVYTLQPGPNIDGVLLLQGGLWSD